MNDEYKMLIRSTEYVARRSRIKRAIGNRTLLTFNEAAAYLGMSPEEFATEAFALQRVRVGKQSLRFSGGTLDFLAMKLGLPEPRRDWPRRRHVTASVRAEVIERDGLVCHLCPGPVTPDALHLDHVVPFSRGGGDDADNLRVAHAICNIRRGNAMLP